jgi:hypothetical protein
MRAYMPGYAPFTGKRGSAWTKSVVDAKWRSKLREVQRMVKDGNKYCEHKRPS